LALSRRTSPRFPAVLARLQWLLRGLVFAVLGTGLAWIGGREKAKRAIAGYVIVAGVAVESYRRRPRKTPKGS